MGLRPPAVTSIQTLVAAYLHLANASRLDLERRAGRYLSERLQINPMAASRILAQLREAGLVAPIAPGSRAAAPVVPAEAFGFRFVEATVGFTFGPRVGEVARPVVALLPRTVENGNPREMQRIQRMVENGRMVPNHSKGGGADRKCPGGNTLTPGAPGTEPCVTKIFPANRGNLCNRGNISGVSANETAAARKCYKFQSSRVVLFFQKKNHTATEVVVTSENVTPPPTLQERKKQAIQNILDHLTSGKKPRGRPPTKKALILAALYIKRRKRLHWDYNPEPRVLLSSMMKAVRLLESVGEPPSQWGAYLDWLFENVGGWTRGRLNVAPVSWVASESRVDAWSARADRKRVLSFAVVDRLVTPWWPDPVDRRSAAGIMCWTLERDLAPGVPSVFGKEPWKEAYAHVWEHRQEVIDGGK